MTLELVPSEERGLPIEQITERWRDHIGYIPDTKNYTFDYHLIDREPPVKLGLTADDTEMLEVATKRVEAKLATYDGLFGINNSQRSARTEILVNARDAAENYNVSRDQLARQVAAGLFRRRSAAHTARSRRGESDGALSAKSSRRFAGADQPHVYPGGRG